MKEYFDFSKKTNFKSLVVMMITAAMFISACYCDNEILKFLFFILGYEGMDIYAYMMYKSNKNK